MDDFEICNPLGSHAEVYKICALYFSIPCLPLQIESKLDKIFFAQLCYSEDRKQFGNEKVFCILLSDLLDLEKDGLFINVENKEIRVKFCVASIIGDNLALHSMLGFNESFSSSYFCRFCYCLKADSHNMTSENTKMLRHCFNYDLLLLNNGLREYSTWNKLTNFHVYQNLFCDILHDLYE